MQVIHSERLLSIQEAQAIALEILDEIDRFCHAHALNYYLIGGALIGAVRSRDLVPWDDDIDIAMTRSDYEAFCRLYKDTGHYALYRVGRTKGYRHGMAKLCDNRTLFIEGGARSVPFGVFVDIFPLDEVGSSLDENVSRNYQLVSLYNYSFVANSDGVSSSCIKKTARWLLANTIGRFSYERAYRFVERKLISSTDNTSMLVNYWGAWRLKEYAPKEWFEHSVPVYLRGKKYDAPSGYREWLTQVYGDYMSPPQSPPHYHGHAYMKEQD